MRAISEHEAWLGRRVRARFAIAALLVVLVVAVFAPVRHHEFVNYDDRVYVLENPSLRMDLGAASLRRAFEPYENNWIPLTWISLQLNHAVHGMQSAGYLLTNVALHAASAVLLFLALLRASGALGCSAFVAAVFAVHPLHVESVAWASERKDALSGLCFGLTILGWVRYAERPGAGRYLPVALAMALGLMAKPMLVTLPFVLLLLDYWPLGRLRGAGGGARPDPARLRRALLEKLPLFTLALAAAVTTFAVQRATGAMADGEALPFGWRVANALDAQVFYLGRSLWPSGLAAFYPHPGSELPLWRPLTGAALLLGLTALALREAARRPYLIVGWLWYAGMLLPVSGLVQVGLQARADRYTYLPLIGLSIAAAWGVADLLGRGRRSRALLAAVGVLAVAALAGAARLQVAHWRDTRALFSRAVAVTRDNYLAHQALATLLLHDGRADEAALHFREALRIKPRWPGAHFGLAEALAQQGDREAALARYEEGLRLAPRHARGRIGYGETLAGAGRHEAAIHQYLRVLRSAGRRDAARTQALLARSLDARGDLAGAIDHYEHALELEPDYAEIHASRGAALLRAGRPEEAAQAFERALALGADSAELRMALAEAAQVLDRPAAAIAHYREALRLDPGSLAAANNLGWLLATDPRPGVRDPDAALQIASDLARGPAADEPALLDTLAASQAAAGHFDAAVATAERAARLAADRGDEPLAAQIRARRDLYAGGRAYLEPAAGTGAR